MVHGLWVIIKIVLYLIGILLALLLLLLALALFVPIRYRFDATYKLLQKNAHAKANWLGPVLRFQTTANKNGVRYTIKFLCFTILEGQIDAGERQG